MPDNNEQIKAFVDRIESDLAVIVLSDGGGVQFDMPLGYLPPGVKSGDHLIIIFRLDPESREATIQSVTDLKRQLTENNDPQETDFVL